MSLIHERREIQNKLMENLEYFKKDNRQKYFVNDWLRDLETSEKSILRRYGLTFNEFIRMFDGFYIGYTLNSKKYLKTEYEIKKHNIIPFRSKFEKVEKIDKDLKCSLCKEIKKRTVLCVKNDEWVCPECCAKCNRCVKSSTSWVCKNCILKKEEDEKCSGKKRIMVNYMGCENYQSRRPYEVME